jgi:hypothetical protein
MLSSRLAQLILQLYLATIEGRVSWEPAAADEKESFSLFFPEYSVRLSKIYYRPGVVIKTPTSAPVRPTEEYDLKLLDTKGEVIETIRTRIMGDESIEGYALRYLLETMYSSARESATGIDRAIDSILDALTKTQPSSADDIDFGQLDQ